MNEIALIPSPPSPLELVYKNHPDKPLAYACSKCGAFFTSMVFGGGQTGLIAAKHAAEWHCHHFCTECRAPVPASRSKCDRCWNNILKQREEKVFEAAKKITIEDYEANQPVYWDGPPYGGSLGLSYFLDIDEFLDACEDEGLDLPSYIWTTKRNIFQADASWLLDLAFHEFRTDARDAVRVDGAEKELQTFLDYWSKKYDFQNWEVDFTTAILLREN